MVTKWENFYRNNSLDKIPWQKTQADYLVKVIKSNKIKTGTALDLGCGTGMKSIYLARKGFKVIGVDISKTAIKNAKENAKNEKLKIRFINADATDLIFLQNKKFDLILDWANLHGIPKNNRQKYISEIVKHTKKGSNLVLRCFSKYKTKKESVIDPVGTVYLFSDVDIKKLYFKNFKILETNISKASSKNSPSEYFNEYLMERI